MVTLSYLANGTSFRRLAYIFRLGRSTVGNIVKDTCNAICDLMYPEYMKTPSTEDEWLAIADGFWRRWNLPNTLGTQPEFSARNISLFRRNRRQAHSH